jgi:predicted RNA-binding protein YlqC (UPF0109 family)
MKDLLIQIVNALADNLEQVRVNEIESSHVKKIMLLLNQI